MDSLHLSIATLVKAALAEDVGKGDLTSLACLEPNPLKAVVSAKSNGVLSGLEPALLTFEIVDSANRVTPLIQDGGQFAEGDIILRIDGFNQTVMAAERVALNFLGHLSGIATLTRTYVDRIAAFPSCSILDTRKTTPGWRLLEKQAVRHGGGTNHRLGLYDMILVKDNHIASAGSVTAAVAQARAFLLSREFRVQFQQDGDKIIIEVEVTNEQELVEAISAGADRLLLDNQSVESLSQLVAISRKLNPAVKLEASGNVSLATVAEIAATGVDFISVGAITHSAPVSDLSLKVVNE